MGYINTDQCDCCKGIWNRVNLHYIPLQSVTLIMCDDCLSEFKNCFVDKHKIDKAVEDMENEVKFWEQLTNYQEPLEVQRNKQVKANSYRHALEILKSDIEK